MRITRARERLDHGKGYEYAHDHPGHFVAQDYLGAEKRYYEPTEQGVEKTIKERLDHWRAKLDESKVKPRKPPDSLSPCQPSLTKRWRDRSGDEVEHFAE